MKRIFPLLLSAFLFLVITGCSQKEERPLTVGTNTWPGYEPLYLAESKGFFPPNRIVLKRLGSASDVLQEFRSNRIDMAALTLDEALLLLDQNFDIKVILVMDVSNGADVLIAQKGITRLGDLKGKRIGYENSAMGALMLERALEAGEVPYESIIPLPAPHSEHERVFNAGTVDAVVTFEPVRTKLLNGGGVQLFDSSMIPGEIIDVLVARTSYIEQHHDEVRTFISGWIKAVHVLQEQPEEAAIPIARMEGISPTEFLDALNGLTIGCLKTNKYFLTGDSPNILAPIGHLQQLMRHYKFISEKPVEGKSLLYKRQAELFQPRTP